MTRTGKKRQRRMIPRLRLAALLLAAILGVLLFSQTAFARTYVITDGDRVVTYTTFATDPAQVLGQAGMELGAYDTYTTEAVEGGSAITIRRAQEITIKYHGEVMQTTSSGETVGELLSRLNLVVSGEDVVSHGMDDSTCDDMVLLVDRMVTVQETYTVTMPHQVSYCNDASLPEGTQEVLVEGVDGELLEMAKVYGVRKSDRLTGIYIPTMFPVFVDGSRSAVSLCVKVVIAAEVLAQTTRSIGVEMQRESVMFEIADLLAWTVVAIVLSFLMEGLVTLVGTLWEKRR